MEAKNDMGIDWAWMVPRPEAARERLEQLIGEQAEEVLARDRAGYEDFAHLPRPAMAPSGEEWVADELLRDALDVDWDNCRRVSFIGLCPTWPIDFLHYPQYEEYVAARADQDWLQDGLGWLREAVGKGRGLYLWH